MLREFHVDSLEVVSALLSPVNVSFFGFFFFLKVIFVALREPVHSQNYDRCPICLHGKLANYRHTSTSFDCIVGQSPTVICWLFASVEIVAYDENNSKFYTNKPQLALAHSAIFRRPPLTPRLHPAASRDSGKSQNP